jgi:asparagine synthase (glutamine-hydrolysing)
VCGISVVLDPAGRPETREVLRRLHAPIPHRGPDGEAFLLVDANGRVERPRDLDAATSPGPVLGLAFRRLKIRDLSDAAAQPMATPDGARVLVFNGEIDNFRELRAELQGHGFRFRSTGDTEVALAAFEAWGEGCFARFEGMWAIVIADLRGRRLVGARDRFGIKPLYWARDGSRLLLASEAKQILEARDERPRAHAPVLARWLRGQRLPGLDDTFFEGIRAVPPATWFEVGFDDARAAPVFRSYWDLAAFSCPDPDRALLYDEARQRLRDTLSQVVASQDVADVTVGCLLSGGLDSAVLAALLARSRGADRPPVTFSFGMPDDPRSELPYVDGWIARTGWPNHRTGLDAGWLAAHAPRAVRALEEPPLSLAALAQYRVFQLCREHGATVVLDGHGADEVLGGYPYHQRTLLLDRARRLRLGALARETRAIARAHHESAWAVLRETVRPGLARRAQPLPAWVDPAYGGGDDDECRAARTDRGRDPSRVNRQLYGDVKWGNAKIVLAFSDRNSMAHSVEARVPYLDRRVVELAFTLPDDYKAGGGQRKRILRDLARDGLVPPAITDRADRIGFPVPEADLLRESAAALDPFVATALEARCLVRAEAERSWSDFRKGRPADPSLVWRLASLGLWTASFGIAT